MSLLKITGATLAGAAGVVVAALATTAYAEPDYMCRVGHKSYPVTTQYEVDDSGDKWPRNIKDGGTLTWRGTTFTNLKFGEQGCKEEILATHDGVIADLCMATKGYASLTVGKTKFDCQMPRARHLYNN